MATATSTLADRTQRAMQKVYAGRREPAGSISNLDTNLIISSGVAVDGGGNVYISGMNLSSSPSTVIVRLPWTGSGYGTPVTLPFSGLASDIAGVAVDSAGNVFYADIDTSKVLMVPWDSATQAYGAQSTLPFTGLSVPKAVTVDGLGNVDHVSDFSSQTIEKLPWNSTTKKLRNAGNGCQPGFGVPAGLRRGRERRCLRRRYAI